MSTENSATVSFSSAMSRLAVDTDLADLTVTCGGKQWKVHSTILAVRSPFFKAAITNMPEKREIDIQEFDPETMDHVINFMYGKLIEKGSFKFLFEAAERFQMDDLKKDVVKLAKKKITVQNAIEIGHVAENYGIENLVGECAKFIVKNHIHMEEEDLSPKLTVMVLSIYEEKLKADNQKENSEDNYSEENSSSSNNSANSSLASLMSKLAEDHDQRDLILTCGELKWKCHSVILAIRSPFFMAAITNNMVEKLDMKIDIKDFDPEAMADVINFMYGTPIGFGAPIGFVKFLFEAAERFQMDDLEEYVIKFAKKIMSLENVVELGHLGEMYNNLSFLADCAEFMVKSDVEMKEDDLSPKLTVLVLSILKDANRGLKDANMSLLEKLKDYENKLREAYRSDLCDVDIPFGSKANMMSHVNGKKHVKKFKDSLVTD